MSPVLKAGLAGGVGVFVAEVLEPKLREIFKPTTDMAAKATKAVAAAAATAGAYWGINKVAP